MRFVQFLFFRHALVVYYSKMRNKCHFYSKNTSQGGSSYGKLHRQHEQQREQKLHRYEQYQKLREKQRR